MCVSSMKSLNSYTWLYFCLHAIFLTLVYNVFPAGLRKIATTHLIPELAGTRITPKLYGRVAEAFVRKYGKYAGWAQTLLFIAELPSQKALLPSILWTAAEKKPTKPRKTKKSKTLIYGVMYFLA